MKKSVLLLLVALLFCCVSNASPMPDFKAGAASFEVNVYPRLNSMHAYSGRASCTTDIGLTYGMGDKLAVQLRAFNPSIRHGGELDEHVKNMSREVNFLYQVSPVIAVFAGFQWAKLEVMTNGSTYKKNVGQIGAVATHNLSERDKLFALFGIDSSGENHNIEIGITRELNKEWEATLVWRQKANRYTVSAGQERDVKFQGFGVGLTCKF